MKTLRLEAFAGLLGLLLLSWLPTGCAHLDYSRNSAAVYEIVEGSPETFRVSDSKLSRIDVVEPLTERRDGRLFVQVQIVNNRGGSKRIEWQTAWYDASGFLVGDPSNWEATRLSAGDSMPLRLTGPTEAASRLRVHVRASDPVE